MSLIRNLSSQWIAAGYVGVVSLLLSMLLGRLMGPETFGAYNFLLSLAAIYGVVQDGGYRMFIMREKAAASLDPTAVESTLVPVSLGHLAVATLFGLAVALSAFGDQRLAVGLAVTVTGGKVLFEFISAYLRGQGAFVADAWWRITVRTITVVAVVAGWLVWESVEAVLLAWLAGQLAAFFLPVARRFIRRPRFGLSKELLRTSLAFLAIDAATVLYFRIDIVMLETLLGQSGLTGNYSAAYRLLEGVIFVLTPLSMIFFRQLRLIWREKDAFERQLVLQLGMMGCLALAVFGAVWLLGGPVMDLTYGAAYGQAAEILPWLFASLFFVLPNSILTNALIVLNREWLYAFAAISSAVFNIGLNFWLIPNHGILGAAWATIATEGLLFGCLVFSHFKARVELDSD